MENPITVIKLTNYPENTQTSTENLNTSREEEPPDVNSSFQGQVEFIRLQSAGRIAQNARLFDEIFG
jgi:hypothetical protein